MPIGQESKPTADGFVRSAVIEARVDVRDLASFARYLLSNGELVKSRSDIVWRAFRSIYETLRLSKEPVFESTTDALAFMEHLGLGSTNRPGRGGRPMNQFTLARQAERENSLDMTELAKQILLKHKVKEGEKDDKSNE